MAKREKRGLRPVQDVLGRLQHDPGFDASCFVIGYEERFSGASEAPLLDFLAGGEIPWHRIQSIRAGSLTVWDRQARVDLVFGSGDSDAADHPAILQACTASAAPVEPAPKRRKRGKSSKPAAALALTPRTCWRFNRRRAAWEPTLPEALAGVESLHVATFNMLFDLHEADRIYSERRVPAALALLRERDADLLALQEVTPETLADLLAEPWVRERYCVSSGPDAEDVSPYGVVLLSRWPLALAEHRFSAHKALLFARLELGGRPLLCAALHLTSDQQGDGKARRATQLDALAQRLGEADVGDVIVLGDFNVGDDDPSENQRIAACGLVDVWSQLRPHDPGFTFDPDLNPLAALMSRRGRAARFDRVLARGLTAIEISRFGDRPFASDGDEQRFASDHFGVAALLEVPPRAAPILDDAPVHQSALVLLPPATSWSAIQEIRAEHDPSYVRWMPHVNLIYGFVPESSFADAAAAITEVLRDRPAFNLRLGGLRRFDHRGSTTVWIELESDPPGALVELQAALGAGFPACREQSERDATGYTPHLTVAKLRGDEATIAATIERLRPRVPTDAWTVDAVHLISRREVEPFAIRRSVSLGGVETLAAPPSGGAWPSPLHRQVASTIAAACVDALGSKIRVHLVGSARLGVAAADADLDLVCVHADPSDDALAAVAAALAPVTTRAVRGGGLRALRGELAGIELDLLFAHAPIDREPDELELLDLDEASRRALLGCVDADALVRLAGPATDAFRGALVLVRRWTRARALEGGAWGLLGGYTWAILVAVATRDAAASDAWTVIRRFFATFAVWPAGRPVCSGPSPTPGTEARRAPWPIYTPTPPVFNSARGLTPSTHALLRRELERAATIVDDAQDEATALASLCTPPPDEPARIVLDVVADGDATLAEAKGAIEGRVLGLLRDLEHAGAQVRPRGWDSRTRAVIGLRGKQASEVAAIVETFLVELRGADDWPANATISAKCIGDCCC